MPHAPAKPCIEPRCPRLAQPGRARCLLHQRARDNQRQAGNPTRWVYQTPRWRRLRLTVLREKPWCPGYPGPGCGSATQHVDHIKSLAQDISLAFDRSNLRAYCPGCHSRKTLAETRGIHQG